MVRRVTVPGSSGAFGDLLEVGPGHPVGNIFNYEDVVRCGHHHVIEWKLRTK